MSRNIRHKSNLTSPKRSARRVSKTSDNSSDEDYAGVDLISDSEEDEPEVEVAEEQAIIESAEDEDADEDDSVSTPRPSGEDDQSNWDGFSMDASQEVLDDDLHFFEDHMSRMHDPDHDIDAALWASKNATSGSPEPRRVRFNLSDSSSTASDNDDVLYPDLFMDQDSLAPSFVERSRMMTMIKTSPVMMDRAGISMGKGLLHVTAMKRAMRAIPPDLAAMKVGYRKGVDIAI